MKTLLKLLLPFVIAAVFMLALPVDAKASEISSPDLGDLADNELITDAEANGTEAINIADKLIESLSSGISAALKSVLPSFASILAVLTLSGLLAAFVDGKSEQINAAYSFLSILSLELIVYPQCAMLMNYVSKCADLLSKVSVSVAAGCTTLYILDGCASAAAVNAASMSLLGTALEVIASGALMPFMHSALALSMAGALPGVTDLSPISKFIKNTITTVMAFVFTIYGFANYVQTAIATAADGYAYRTIRFSAGVMIPVIGNMLGEASRTVSGSIAVMRATVGSAGIAAVIATLLPPVIMVLCYRIVLSLSAVAAGLLGCERERRFLSDLSGMISVLFALVSGVALTAVITLAMFIRMGNQG